ncbi:MAG TPA: sulfotransferase family protein, partial [Gammaproteobacteria bacterium]|nr:sulfotransferase family protein [Gammaproteobacteria bacterium]
MAEVNCDGNFVMKNLLNLNDENGKEVLFLKQMTKHLVDVDRDFLPKFKNILLIRNPRDMLPSLAENITRPILADTGLDLQWHL